MTKEMYQNIILELDDGRLITASIPAFCHRGEEISVRNVRVTDPEELPEGYSVEGLETEKKCQSQ